MAYLAQYTPVQRRRIILVGLALLALAAYFLSIRNTINIRRQLEDKTDQLEQVHDAPTTIRQLQQQLKQTDQALLQTTYNRNQLFATVSYFCDHHELKLLDFPDPWQWQENELQFTVSPIRVSGSYQNLLRLMYHLEFEERLGFLIHTEFRYERENRRTKKKRLVAELHLQYIEPFASQN